MLESMADCLEVLVLLSLVAVLFSCTTMLRISPTVAARLSPTMEREEPLRQSESARTVGVWKPSTSAPRANSSKRNKNGLFILHLSTEFTSRLRIPHPHHLPGSPIFQHFDFE